MVDTVWEGKERTFYGGEAKDERKRWIGVQSASWTREILSDLPWIWVRTDAALILDRETAPCRDKSLVAGALGTIFKFCLPHLQCDPGRFLALL